MALSVLLSKDYNKRCHLIPSERPRDAKLPRGTQEKYQTIELQMKLTGTAALGSCAELNATPFVTD